MNDFTRIKVATLADMQRAVSKRKSKPESINVGIHGHFKVTKEFSDGTIEVVLDKDNQIVERMLVATAMMIGSTGAEVGDEPYDNLRPWFVALGDGGLTAPTDQQTNLQGTYLYSRAWDSRTFSSTLGSGLTNQVTYEFRIPENDPESLGLVFSEAGVFGYDYQGSASLGLPTPTAPSGGMYSRIVFSDIEKQNSFVLAIQWTYRVTIA